MSILYDKLWKYKIRFIRFSLKQSRKIYNPFSKRTDGNITEIDLNISAKKRKLALTYQNHVTRAKKKEQSEL